VKSKETRVNKELRMLFRIFVVKTRINEVTIILYIAERKDIFMQIPSNLEMKKKTGKEMEGNIRVASNQVAESKYSS